MLKNLLTNIYFIFLLSALALSGNAQEQIVFRNYSVSDGLRSNTVWCINQDDQGYMWFGTKNGLSRFNGYQFKSYHFDKQDQQSISDNFIHSIHKFDSVTYWLGTETGISILDLKKESFHNFEPLKGNVVFDIVKDKKGIVWIATKTNGLFRYDPKTKNLKNFKSTNKNSKISSNQVRKLAIDKAGNIWVGTFGNGLDKFDPVSFKFQNFRTENSGISNNFILTVYADLNGDIWAGTLTGGLAYYNQQKNDFKIYRKGKNSINDNIVRSINQPNKNTLYIGTEKGLNILDLRTGEFKVFTNQISDPLSISDNAVYSIFNDREGGVWIGTFFGGVNYFQEKGSEFELYYPTANPKSLSGSAVSAFLEDKPGYFWIGTEDGGLNYYNSKDKTFQHYPFLPNQQNLSYHNIHSLFKDNEGNIWIGTFTGGLNVYNPKTGKVRQYQTSADPNSLSNNSIYSIYQDLDGKIWVGTVKGLNLYNKKTDNFTRIKNLGLGVNCIYSIYEDASRTMWYGTYDSGLIAHQKETDKWFSFSADGKEGSISSNKVISMMDDHQGNLWVGTDGGGLNKLDLRTHKFSVFDSKKGISANVIYGILQDNKRDLWISTNDGLYTFQPSTDKVNHFTNWDYLQSRQFNYSASYKALDGKLYFGGISGFNAFHPDSINKSNIQTEVAFTNFQLFNRDVKVNDESGVLTSPINYAKSIVVPYNQSVVSFEYAALSYVSPKKTLYAYKLEGFDKNWNYVGDQRKATFTNLPPGDYNFLVKASTDEQNWDVPTASIKLTVKPPFYRTYIAYLIYILAAVAFFFFAKRYLAKKALKRNQIRLERLKVIREKEFYTQKIDFFTEMAHEIRTPLSLITAPLEKLLEIKKWEPQIQKQLSVMDENSNRLLTLVNQLLDFRRIESDIYQIHKEEIDIVALIQSLYSRFSAMEYQKGIKFTLSTKVSNLLVQADPEALTKIFSNLIINAFKFTRTKVKVSIQEPFDEEGQHFFKINIEDDGIGIPESEIGNIFTKFFKVTNGGHHYNNLGGTGIGLALAKSLTEKHGGKLEVNSTQNVNTVFSVIVPFMDVVLQELEIPQAPIPEEINEDEELDAEKSIVLIVEDDNSLSDFYDQNLNLEGYKVLKASNGLEALASLKKNHVDLILSDVMMPEMDGLELCHEVKSSINYSHIPFILLTAKANSESEIAGIENGADAYITKPFKWKHVTAVIKNLMESHARLKEKFADQPFFQADSLTSNTKDKKFLEKITEIIESRIMDPQLSVEELSRDLAMSRSSLHKKLKSLSGYVPNEFIRLVRLKHAAKLLLTNDYNISEIGYMVGFNSHSYFSKCFFNQFKLTPTEFQEQHVSKEVSE